MKRNIALLVCGLVVLTAFTACDKNNDGNPVVPEGKILLNAGYIAPTSDAKYTFNIDIKQCFFNSGDAVYINGVPYAIFPYDNSDPDNDSASNRARIWADISQSHVYKGLYPYEAFVNADTNLDCPTVRIPASVYGIPADTWAPSYSRINATQDGRIMPTTAYTTSSGIEDSLFFRNTTSLLFLTIRYNYAFGKAIDSQAGTGGREHPVIIVDSIRITATNGKLSGPGAIQNPYTDHPTVVLDNTASNSITYTLDHDPYGIYATTRLGSEIAFLPIVSNLNTPALMEIFFTAREDNGMSTMHRYKYTKLSSSNLTTVRNQITFITVKFSTASDFTQYVTELP